MVPSADSLGNLVFFQKLKRFSVSSLSSWKSVSPLLPSYGKLLQQTWYSVKMQCEMLSSEGSRGYFSVLNRFFTPVPALRNCFPQGRPSGWSIISIIPAEMYSSTSWFCTTAEIEILMACSCFLFQPGVNSLAGDTTARSSNCKKL